LEVGETITHLLDPEASRLPRLRDPKGVGDGLLGVSVTYLLLASLVLLPSALPTLLALSGAQGGVPWWPVSPWLLSSVIGFLGLWWLHLLVRSPAEAPAEAARSGTRWILAGQIGWSIAVLAPLLGERQGVEGELRTALLETIRVPFAAAALIGLRRLLGIVGLRSRAYRNAKGGRQSIDALIGAMLAGAVGRLASASGATLDLVWLETIGQTLFGASAALLLLGLVYLLVNCWWIRSALRKPPPTLDELLRIPSAPSGAPSGDDRRRAEE